MTPEGHDQTPTDQGAGRRLPEGAVCPGLSPEGSSGFEWWTGKVGVELSRKKGSQADQVKILRVVQQPRTGQGRGSPIPGRAIRCSFLDRWISNPKSKPPLTNMAAPVCVCGGGTTQQDGDDAAPPPAASAANEGEARSWRVRGTPWWASPVNDRGIPASNMTKKKRENVGVALEVRGDGGGGTRGRAG